MALVYLDSVFKDRADVVLIKLIKNSLLVCLACTLTANTFEFRKGVGESTLSWILQVQVQEKYYLRARACKGILERAARKGKTLLDVLNRALIRQSDMNPQKLDFKRSSAYGKFTKEQKARNDKLVF